jgi:hypothetical protein
MSGLLVFKRLDGQKFLPLTTYFGNNGNSKVQSISPNWMYVGVTTMYKSEEETNGKQPSKQTKDFSNPL